MGLRGELFSSKVILQNRSYFFNVKENRMGDLYLNIVESKNREEGGFNRQSVILFADDLQEFLKGFDESLRVLEKEVRTRRRGDRSVIRNTADDSERSGKFDGGKRHERETGSGSYGGEKRRGREFNSGGRGESPDSRRKDRHPKDDRPKDGRRVIVRKRKRIGLRSA